MQQIGAANPRREPVPPEPEMTPPRPFCGRFPFK